MIYIGIDPGQSGGIASLVGDNTGTSPACVKMPETEKDCFDALEKLQRINFTAIFAVIESVHSMPKQGVASSFKFGRNYGFLRGCLIALGIPFEEVTPQKWQKALGCLSHGDKNVTKARAQQLFPALKITHATADALLLAEYCRRTRV